MSLRRASSSALVQSWMHRSEDLYDNSDRPNSFFRFHADTTFYVPNSCFANDILTIIKLIAQLLKSCQESAL